MTNMEYAEKSTEKAQKALLTIKEICAMCQCCFCPFSDENDECIVSHGDEIPAGWEFWGTENLFKNKIIRR